MRMLCLGKKLMSKSKIVIAVTGHRDIVEPQRLRTQVNDFFDDILTQYDEVRLLSPLAEGADQFVAEIFLEKSGKEKYVVLDVPLPLNQETYIKDFNITSSKRFLSLVSEANYVFEVPRHNEHPFENLGRYIVDTSDILLALWDGKTNDKRGGTGDVVSYAKSQNHQIVHLLCERKKS